LKTQVTLSLEIESRVKLEQLAAQSDTYMSTIVEDLIEKEFKTKTMSDQLLKEIDPAVEN
jgi:hypothetical protein